MITPIHSIRYSIAFLYSSWRGTLKTTTLILYEAIPRDFFDLSGIANYAETADKTSVSFVYNGNITAIIDKLHLLHLDDVLLEEPSLEEIFMHYYA